MTNKTSHILIISGIVVLSLLTIITSTLSLYYISVEKFKTQNQPIVDKSSVLDKSSNSTLDNDKQELLTMPSEELSQNEKDSLLYIREEEKLARDVYLTMADIHNIQIFRNIASSEQTHMDVVQTLIDKYNLTDSMKSDRRGEFNNPEFLMLYNDHIAKGSESQISALKVGATIEDLDINDLNKRLLNTDNQDIKAGFEKLRSGSYNHLRAFVRNLRSQGDNYAVQYISQTDLEAILNSSSGNQTTSSGQKNKQGMNR